jgi:hypothetical protein
MWNMRISAALAVMLLTTSSGAAISCGSADIQKSKPPARVISNKAEPGASQESGLKVLASGPHAGMTDPFVALARDAETYRALTELSANLPKLDEDFFKSNAVLAVFLGTRSTGGYSVEIARAESGEIRVAEKRPPKDAMVTQVITSPFKLVAVPIDERTPLIITLDTAWEQKMRPYEVTSGQFTMSGGFAGRVEEFPLRGKVRVMRVGGLATFSFSLEGSSRRRHRSLSEVATGIVKSSRAITIHKLSAGSLIDPPHSGLMAEGGFSQGGKRLSLKFTSLPSMIADGFSGEGSIEARTSGRAPKP